MNKRVLISVREGKLADAQQQEAAMRKIQWVIGLPRQIISELAKGGENT